MASALVADLVIAGGDLGNVLLHDVKAGQHSIGLLVFRLSADNHALQFAAHGRNLTLDRANRFLDARGVLAGIAGKAAYILRYDGESLAEFACARRFDRAIHRQHVGLYRHHADSINDLVDIDADVFKAGNHIQALTRRFDRPHHALRQVGDLRPAFAEHGVHPLGALKRCGGALAERLGGLFDLIHRCAGLLGRGSLLLCTAADLIDCSHDLRGRPRHFLNGGGELLGRGGELIGAGIAGRSQFEVGGKYGQRPGCGLALVEHAGLLLDTAKRFRSGSGLLLGSGGNDLGALLRLASGRFQLPASPQRWIDCPRPKR